MCVQRHDEMTSVIGTISVHMEKNEWRKTMKDNQQTTTDNQQKNRDRAGAGVQDMHMQDSRNRRDGSGGQPDMPPVRTAVLTTRSSGSGLGPASKMYRLETDPGHGWLRVEKREIAELGIAGRISGFSHVSGRYAFLEEDRDAAIFADARMSASGRDVFEDVDEKHVDHESVIRGMDRYTPESVSHA